MILDADKPIPGTSVKPRDSFVFDWGANARIPFVIRCDFATGDYEAHVPAPNGVDVMVDPYTRKPLVRKGKGVGRLELMSKGKAHLLGQTIPKKVAAVVQPMTKDERIAGMEQYKRLHHWTWAWRGESRRCVADRWDDFLMDSPFLDDFLVLKQRQG